MTDPRPERDLLAGFRAPPPDAALRTRTLAAARAALERRPAPARWRAALAALRASPALASLVALLLLAHALLFLVPSPRRSASPDRSPRRSSCGSSPGRPPKSRRSRRSGR